MPRVTVTKESLREALAEAYLTKGKISDAARFTERLLPATCPNDFGGDGWHSCAQCHDGQLWDEGLVEVVAKAIHSKDDGSYVHDWDKLADWRKDEYRGWARAVLSALAQEVSK